MIEVDATRDNLIVPVPHIPAALAAGRIVRGAGELELSKFWQVVPGFSSTFTRTPLEEQIRMIALAAAGSRLGELGVRGLLELAGDVVRIRYRMDLLQIRIHRRGDMVDRLVAD